ncbi:MAG: glycosyltransferase [Phycisphaerales bacterium]|nr:glycosyltransferase [Phycisphaerales bacterium]
MPPFWSVVIPTYNRPEVIRALRSVLAQDLGPDRMHIAVIDNASSALDVESLIKQASPPNRVHFHRNATNLGMHGNWNACIAHAIGEEGGGDGQWVHILHDDDLIYPGFYRAMETAIESAPTIAAAFCSAQLVDGSGNPLAVTNLERPSPGIYPNLLDRLLQGNAIQFAAIVVRRDVYQQVGGFDPALDYVADWDMWMRITARFPGREEGGVWYEPQILAAYTQHPGSETSALMRSGRERRGYTAAADRWLTYAGVTPENIARQARQKEIFAQDGLHIAAQSFARNDFWAGFHQLCAALDCSSSPSVLKKAGIYFPYLLNRAPLLPEKRCELSSRFPWPFPAVPDRDTWQKLLDFLK